MNPMKDPLLEVPLEEIEAMSREEFGQLLERSNGYVRNKYRNLKKSKQDRPQFKSEEEFYAYYNAVSFEEADRLIDKIFNKDK